MNCWFTNMSFAFCSHTVQKMSQTMSSKLMYVWNHDFCVSLLITDYQERAVNLRWVGILDLTHMLTISGTTFICFVYCDLVHKRVCYILMAVLPQRGGMSIVRTQQISSVFSVNGLLRALWCFKTFCTRALSGKENWVIFGRRDELLWWGVAKHFILLLGSTS